MAWDDAPPDAAAAWDSTPPKPEELEPSFLEKTAANIIPDIKETAKGLGDIASGPAADIMSGDVASAIPKLAKEGKSFFANPVENAKAMAEPITHPIDYFQKHPVQQTLNAAGALAGLNEMRAPAEAPIVRETIPPTPEAAPDLVPMPPEAPKGLPVVQPGAKTGAPHALFSYNDKFGPGGTERSLYNVFGDPEHPAIKARGWGSSVPAEDLEKIGIPITGREPTSTNYEPLPNIPKSPPKTEVPPPPKAADPLQDIKDYLKKTQGKIEAKPGWQENAAKYVKNEVADLRAKDIGMRDPMIRSLDPKHPFAALKKAEDLMTYAGDQGYFKPGLSNVARKELIESKLGETGNNIGAVRNIAGQRAQPPVAEIREAIKNGLESEYGEKASHEINTVLGDFDRLVKKDPSFQGLSDVATYLNGEKKTFNKIGQNPGPTTDAANILSSMNNEAIRKVLSPEENTFYTKNLRDFGAHKKLEQMVASAARRGMTGRGAPGGALAALWQQLWDRGGYRVAGNVADRLSTSVLKNPSKFKTLPDFFEELAHHTGDVLDESIEGAPQGMYKGGRVPDDVKRYVSSKC